MKPGSTACGLEADLRPAKSGSSVKASIPAGGSPWKTTYLRATEVGTSSSRLFTPRAGRLPELPRVGMRMMLPTGLDTITWYGRGPEESYADRHTVRRSASTAGTRERPMPSLHPAAGNGYKTDVRWVALTDPEKGVGLFAAGSPVICTAAGRFFHDDYEYGFEKAMRHTIDMKPRDLVVLNVDLAQMGLGRGQRLGRQASRPVSSFPESLHVFIPAPPLQPGGEFALGPEPPHPGVKPCEPATKKILHGSS